MAQLSVLPSAAEDVCNGWLADKNDHMSLAGRPQILRVHKLLWKDDKSSRNWLERISKINSGVFRLSAESTNCPGELVNKQEGSTTKQTLENSNWAVKQRSTTQGIETDESSLPISEGPRSRKPDSTYIRSISRINLSFSEVSKKCYSHETLIASLLQPKHDKFATQFLTVNEAAFFPSEGNLQAKRKLSFEYIQDVSMLQYGHNSVENGIFRR